MATTAEAAAASAAKNTVAEFDAKHGRYLIEKDMVLFADGARRENAAFCRLEDAPADANERAKRVARYCRIAAERAERAFTDRKTVLVEKAEYRLAQDFCGFAAAKPEAAAAELRALKAAVESARTARDAAEREIVATQPKFEREHEARDAANRQANEALLKAIEDIDI